MLTVSKSATQEQREEILRSQGLIQALDAYLGDREGRVFPPEQGISASWEIFVRYSPMASKQGATFVDAAWDLVGQLQKERDRQITANAEERSVPYRKLSDYEIVLEAQIQDAIRPADPRVMVEAERRGITGRVNEFLQRATAQDRGMGMGH